MSKEMESHFGIKAKNGRLLIGAGYVSLDGEPFTEPKRNRVDCVGRMLTVRGRGSFRLLGSRRMVEQEQFQLGVQ